MKLQSVRVQNYRVIDDSGWVPIDDLTCFIGRNESGKTTFLEALEGLNPAHGAVGYEPYEDYPRQDWPAYGSDGDEVVVQGRFVLDETEVTALEMTDGRELPSDVTVTASRDYAGSLRWELELDEPVALEESVAAEVLEPALPAFRYVGEYATIDGTIDVEAVLERRDEGALTPGDGAFLSLLSVAGLDPERFRDVDDWREATAELEAASAAVSDEAMAYWSQSGDISVRIQHRAAADRDLLDLRVENHRHGVTVEFDQRSQGFRRFFSTFCQLAALRESDDSLVVMIDEPGRSLHARAKQEFLEFLNTELVPKHTLLYTTHSPFMLDPERLHSTKLVMAEPVGEYNVTADVTQADTHTTFPLRNAFEFDLMETLLVKPYTLVVEHRADHIYLSVLSQLLEDAGTEGLDSRWTVVPIRSHRNISTFTGLFGEERLEVAALLSDDPTADRSRRRGDGDRDLSDVHVLTVQAFTGAEGTVEDLLSESFYLDIVSRAYAKALAESPGVGDRIDPDALGDDGPIVERVRAFFQTHGINDGRFDREVPARYLQAERETLASALDKPSKRTFTKVFRGLDNTLASFDSVEPERGSLFNIFR